MQSRPISNAIHLIRPCVAVMAMLMASCADTRPLSDVTIPRPHQSEAVTPQADKVRRELDRAKTTTIQVKAGMDAAVDEANRLRQQKTATEKELADLWAILTKEKERLQDLWNQLGQAQVTSEEMSKRAAQSDAEVITLRASVDTLNGKLKAASKWEAKAADKVAVYDFFVRWAWRIALFLIAGLILYIVVRYWPAIAARFAKPFP